MTVIEDIARWTSGLRLEDVPERVREVARNQVLSVMGAVHASAGCAGGKAVIETVGGLAEQGPCSKFPGGERTSLSSALLQNCSLSMALDYDDYEFLGHSGHSAVCVSLAVGQLRGADTAEVLAAQVAANEVAGRLGASVVLGPHNGQMWAHIHLLGAAAGAARVLGLDEEATADALGIAMAEPVYALFPGFMGPQSKLLTATTPALTGTNAALLAEKGMTGSRSILEDPQGFWTHFAFVPLPFMMGGLGRSWVTDTIAFKPYPGCAYIDTSMDALFEIMGDFSEDHGRALEPGEVREVRVKASLLTCAMDAISREYLDREHLSPTNINFSLSISIAIGLLAGRLTGAELTEEYLTKNREDILALAARVKLEHSGPLTVEFIRCMDEEADMASMLGSVDVRALMRSRQRMRRHLSHVGTLGGREALDAWRSLDSRDRAFLKGLALRAIRERGCEYDLGEARFDRLRMPFGARMEVLLSDGKVLGAERSIPRGAPGDPGRFEVCSEKFVREAGGLLGKKKAAKAVKVVRGMEGATLDDIVSALSP
ncbi:MAG: MmgE/PrpD family protein [Actinomycetota bacterium]